MCIMKKMNYLRNYRFYGAEFGSIVSSALKQKKKAQCYKFENSHMFDDSRYFLLSFLSKFYVLRVLQACLRSLGKFVFFD